MDIQEIPRKESKEQATQTEEMKAEDFLKLNEEGHHQIAYNYIYMLHAKYSKEDLNQAIKKIQQLDAYMSQFINGIDVSLSYEDRGRASVSKEYAKMAHDDKDGLIIISYLEVFYKSYREQRGELPANEFFQELLLLASHVMKGPKLLKELYDFNGKA